jgi:hypothetical protein
MNVNGHDFTAENDDEIVLAVTVSFTHKVHKRYFELTGAPENAVQEVCDSVAEDLQDSLDILGAVLTEHDGELTVNVKPAEEDNLS